MNAIKSQTSAGFEESQRIPLPGRLGSNEIRMVSFGWLSLFFYMTQQKYELAKSLVEKLNCNEIQFNVITDGEVYPSIEIEPTLSTYPDQIGLDDSMNPVYKDTRGSNLMLEYAQKTKKIVKETLGLNIEGSAQTINTVFTSETLQFHQDRMHKQYSFLQSKPLPMDNYYLLQDLTLIDWQMGQGTVSGTLIHDYTGDRFLIGFDQKEIVGNLYLEPVDSTSPNEHPKYPGGSTFPLHTIIHPIDRHGDFTAGSLKGKRISSTIRGVVKESEVIDLKAKALPLPLNRREKIRIDSELSSYVYSNGIEVISLSNKTRLVVNLELVSRLPEKEGVEILQSKSLENSELIEYLLKLYCIKTNLSDVLVFHLIKKDGGFSEIGKMNSNIPSNSHVLLVNDSDLPEHYHYYNLAEDATNHNLPWLQLYQFEPNKVMKMTPNILMSLSLTPLEELLFRDAEWDAKRVVEPIYIKKLVTRIHVFIFPILV